MLLDAALVPAHGALGTVRDTVVFAVAFLAAAAAFVQRGRAARATGAEWAFWATIGWGIAASTAGTIWVTLMVHGAEQGWTRLVGHVLHVTYYLLLYVALVRGLRARVLRWIPAMALDAVLVALTVWAVAAWAVLPGLLADAPESTVAVVVAVFYPVADMLLAMLTVIGLVVLRVRPDPAWIALTLGVAVVTVTDVVETLVTNAGASQVPPGIFWSYLVAAAVAVSATWLPDSTGDVSSDPDAAARWSATLTPTLAGVVSVLLLLPGGPATGSPVVHWLALAGLVVAGVRSALTFRDVWRLAAAQREARTDELTGLVNRRGFMLRAEASIAAAAGPDADVALLMLDLDGFKEVNDSLGHQAGDRLLQVVAERLRTVVGRGDLLARLGGDEFALVLEGTDRAGALGTAALLAEAVARPVVLHEVQVDVAVSVGVALAPEHGRDLTELMRHADLAMYRAKSARTAIELYDARVAGADGEDRLQRVAELRRAVTGGQLVVHYQPKVDLAGGRVVGVEALVRWAHPERGLVPPDDFLPLVDSAGLMPALTSVVLEDAVRQAAAWWAGGHRFAVSVNLPVSVLVDDDLPARVDRLLRRHRLPAGALQLEITEESLLRDRARARAVLADLRRRGVQIAIDDYGSGYSSLAYLRELPVDELKLDRSFVAPMADDPRAASIVRSTIDLAHALGMSIVAEGVEHAQVVADLAASGCDSAQGFYFARPQPAAQLTAWLAARTLPQVVVDR